MKSIQTFSQGCLRWIRSETLTGLGIENFPKGHLGYLLNTVSYAPQQNGIIERMNRTVVVEYR